MDTELSNLFVVCMGVGIVFIGLICIIFLCKIMSAIVCAAEKKASAAAPAQASAVASEEIPNRQEFVAAVAAALAEDMGTDISAIRILSIKKV